MDDLLDIEVVAEIEIDVENEVDVDVEVEQAGPQGKDGLSAYEIYLQNGGILTEAEWLKSLKGEPGQAGKTPVLGEDYWTEADKETIKSYCNEYIEQQIGFIENGEY